MSGDENEIDDLLKGVFGAMKAKKKPLEALNDKDTAATFGAEIAPPEPGEKVEREVYGEIPISSESIAEVAAEAALFPKEMPKDLQEDFLILSNGTALFLGAFVALTYAHNPKATTQDRKNLYRTCQGLCNRAAKLLKNLKTVQFAVSKPNATGNLTIQITNQRKEKKGD